MFEDETRFEPTAQRGAWNALSKESQMYELHIAAAMMPVSALKRLSASLTSIGIQDTDFFYRVADVRPSDDACHPAGTPPTGHDLAHPGSMSTVKVRTYAEAKRLIIAGMEILKQHGIDGNFEIEGIISQNISDYPSINVAKDFPSFKRVEDAPDYESHIIWNGTGKQLPTFNQIIRFFEKELLTTPHQIVDFGLDPVCTKTTEVCRVATVYQPSRAATLSFAKRLSWMKNTLDYRYSVAEQVILVGAPMH